MCWSVLGQAALVGIPSPDASLLGACKYQVRPRYSERQAWKQQAVWVMALGCLFVVAKLQRRGLKYFSHRACDQCRESSRTWCIGALPSERWMQLSGWVYALCCPAVLYHRQHGYWRWSKLLKWASLWNCHSGEDKSWLKAGFLNAVEKNHCEIKCRKIYVSSVSLCSRQMWGKSTTQLLGWVTSYHMNIASAAEWLRTVSWSWTTFSEQAAGLQCPGNGDWRGDLQNHIIIAWLMLEENIKIT